MLFLKDILKKIIIYCQCNLIAFHKTKQNKQRKTDSLDRKENIPNQSGTTQELLAKKRRKKIYKGNYLVGK